MTRQLTWSIVADGGTDRLLVPIIEWAIHRVDPQVEILEPQFRKRRGSVKQIPAKQDSGDMLVFVHRDSEGISLEERLQEFEGVERPDVVPVVPVQMSEAWILFDARAIAKAAGAPSARIGAPRVAELESIANPKQRLDELLVAAAGNYSACRGVIGASCAFLAAGPHVRTPCASLGACGWRRRDRSKPRSPVPAPSAGRLRDGRARAGSASTGRRGSERRRPRRRGRRCTRRRTRR